MRTSQTKLVSLGLLVLGLWSLSNLTPARAEESFLDRFMDSFYSISANGKKLSEAKSKAEADRVAKGVKKLYGSSEVSGPFTRITAESITRGINQTIREQTPRTYYEVISATGSVSSKQYPTRADAEKAVAKGGRVRGPIYVYPPQAIVNPFRVPTDRQPIWEAEGNEGGRFHTRDPHVPSTSSGVTIGRGYDVGTKLSAEDRQKALAGNAAAQARMQAAKDRVIADLIAAGLPRTQAEAYAEAVGLYGQDARDYIQNHRDTLGSITPEQQLALFNRIYPQYVNSARTTVETHFGVQWADLSTTMQNALVDLNYRGDLNLIRRNLEGKTPAAGAVAIRNAIQNRDNQAFYEAMRNEAFWFPSGGNTGRWSLPRNRFDRRIQYLREALGL